jgi:Domain of Unknown Function with PDB structure (DUF3857)/Domain of Unknown Function with PDB structure (DUF3858)
MNILNFTRPLLALLLMMVLAGSALAANEAQLGMSAGHDLDQLWSQAQKTYDLKDHDAVVLLESHQVTITADGKVQSRTHRVVWIGSAVGLRNHADLRIGWNSETSSLKVEKLRTWREARWWPDETKLSKTAIVETLPYAVDHADDYTGLRETMLLHDGIDLPCILETAYVIEEDKLPGADGLFVFPVNDVAVKTELTVTVPAGGPFSHQEINGAPAPTESTDTVGMLSLSWTLENSPALRKPTTVQPEAYEPAVVWSTWESWQQLEDHFTGAFAEAAVLSEALVDSLNTRLMDVPGTRGRLQAIADFVNESTRSIHTSDHYWRFDPRPAVQTWETAYGNTLDRAVLAGALLTQAGFHHAPLFVGAGYQLVAPEIPRLASLGDLHLAIQGQAPTTFDPDHGTLTGSNDLIGHPVWLADGGSKPALAEAKLKNHIHIDLKIEPGDDNTWQGTGYLDATGLFCAYGELAGTDQQMVNHLNSVMRSLLPGATVTGANCEIFNEHQVVLGFGFDMAAIDADDLKRIRMVFGDPGDGVLRPFRHAGHLYDTARQSPVLLPGEMSQSLTLKIQTKEMKPVQIPLDSTLENEAGRFAVSSEKRNDGFLVVSRELQIRCKDNKCDNWPALRALLLEENDAANRVIVLEEGSK